MPHYDYVCDGCRHEFEVFQAMSESRKRKCPECGRFRLRRLLGSGGGILFRGSGFYETDYKAKEATVDCPQGGCTAGGCAAKGSSAQD